MSDVSAPTFVLRCSGNALLATPTPESFCCTSIPISSSTYRVYFFITASIKLYMGVLIQGVNTLYTVFCLVLEISMTWKGLNYLCVICT